MVEIREGLHSMVSVLGHSFAAIIGFIAANYIGLISGLSNVTQLIAGLVLVAIPAFFLRGGGHVEGPVRLGIGVAGLTLILRSIAGPSGMIITDANFPAAVKAVI